MPTQAQIKNRQKLIKALRSGEYRQGARGYLKSHGYCCQGVACEISGLGKFSDRFWVSKDGSSPYYWTSDVQDHYGFTFEDSRALAAMNDGRQNQGYTEYERCTFGEIADLIELLTLAEL